MMLWVPKALLNLKSFHFTDFGRCNISQLHQCVHGDVSQERPEQRADQ